MRAKKYELKIQKYRLENSKFHQFDFLTACYVIKIDELQPTSILVILQTTASVLLCRVFLFNFI